MFEEIVLLRLEIAMRLVDAASAPIAPRFVPLPRGMRLKFKTRLAAV